MRNTIYHFVIARSEAKKQSRSLIPTELIAKDAFQSLVLSYKTKDIRYSGEVSLETPQR